jgi:hypothetical protein
VAPLSSRALRENVGKIGSVSDLQRAAEILSRRLGLPRAPHVTVGYVPWKGPATPVVDTLGAGSFTIARWAVRGKYRRSWESLEYALVCAVGFWLESHRREPLFEGHGTSEALIAWYGEQVGAPLAESERRRSRLAKLGLSVLGVLLAAYLVLWFIGVAN